MFLDVTPYVTVFVVGFELTLHSFYTIPLQLAPARERNLHDAITTGFQPRDRRLFETLRLLTSSADHRLEHDVVVDAEQCSNDGLRFGDDSALRRIPRPESNCWRCRRPGIGNTSRRMSSGVGRQTRLGWHPHPARTAP
jgi:hypothetical protein